MDGSNGTEGEENLSSTPPNIGEKVAILDAGAQYGKVLKHLESFSFKV